jgi:DNA-binding transcriptional LysR family regulator
MNTLKYIPAFVRLAESGTFTAAALQLGIAKSAVSKQISQLETLLDAQLFVRSTRKTFLTEAGQRYHEYCKNILELHQSAEDAISFNQQSPRGLVRLSSDQSFAKLFLAPLVVQLTKEFPLLKFELACEDKIVNIIEEDIHLTIRVGWLEDSSLRAIKLADSPFVVFSAPSYLETHPEPKSPQDLSQHNWVELNLLPEPRDWHFSLKDSEHHITVVPSVSTNSLETLISLIKSGGGVSALAQHSIQPQLDSGELVQVLRNFSLPSVGIYAVYPRKQGIPFRVKLVLERLKDMLMNRKMR